MLQQVCDFVHNYFKHYTYYKTFTVTNGSVEGIENLAAIGQRFKIIGSALNDGIYTRTADGIFDDDGENAIELNAETFDGCIIAMSVPIAFLRLVQDIKEWVEKNRTALESPYQSESFGGYSYTKAVGVGANAGGVVGWQDVFRSRLNAYRKIA